MRIGHSRSPDGGKDRRRFFRCSSRTSCGTMRWTWSNASSSDVNNFGVVLPSWAAPEPVKSERIKLLRASAGSTTMISCSQPSRIAGIAVGRTSRALPLARAAVRMTRITSGRFGCACRASRMSTSRVTTWSTSKGSSHSWRQTRPEVVEKVTPSPAAWDQIGAGRGGLGGACLLLGLLARTVACGLRLRAQGALPPQILS